LKKQIFAIGMTVMLCFTTAFAADAPVVKVDTNDGSIHIYGKTDVGGNLTITVFNDGFTGNDGVTEEDFKADSAAFQNLNDDEKSDSIDWARQITSEDGKYDIKYKSFGSKGRYAVLVADKNGNTTFKYFTFVKDSDKDAVLNELNALTDVQAVADFIEYYSDAMFNIPEYDTLTDAAKAHVAEEVLNGIGDNGYADLNKAVELFAVNTYVKSFYASDADAAAKLVNDKRDILDVESLDENFASGNDTYKSQVCEYILDAGETDYEGWCKAFKKAAEKYAPDEDDDGGSGGGGRGSGGSSKLSGFKADTSLVSAPTQSTSALYKDVDYTHWAYESISTLTARGILSGDGVNFRPEDSVTRAEFLKMVLSALELYDGNAKCSFDDVPIGAWYYPYVASANEISIVSGQGNNLFNPDASISRQDAVKIMHNTALFKNTILKETRDYAEFIDEAEIAEYASTAVKVFYNAGIINGYTDGGFRPNGMVTRAEAAKMVFSFLQSGI